MGFNSGFKGLNIILTKLEFVCLMNLREQYIWEMLLIVYSDTFIIHCTLQNAEYTYTGKCVCVCARARACMCGIFGHKWE